MENRLARSMDWDEVEAIIQAAKVLEKGFKKTTFKIIVNPNEANPTDAWGILFSFDLNY